MEDPDLAGEMVARGMLLVTMIGAGVAIIWTARAAASGRLKRNGLAGIRVRATMTSDEAWLAAHRASRWYTEVAGWIAIAAGACLLFPLSMPTASLIILGGTVALLALVIYGAVVGVRAARAQERRLS